MRLRVILVFCFHLSSSCDIGEPGMGSALLSFLGSQPIAMLLVSVYLILLFHLIAVSFSSICVFISLCVASVALALVFMPGLYSAAYRATCPAFMWLPLVCFYCLCDFVCVLYFLFIATMSFAGYFLVHSLLSAFPAYLRTYFRFDLVWFCLSCDHGWIRSGSVNVR